jgi:hypothetical protein
MEHVSLVRSMKTREGDHSRATYLMRTGYLPQGPVQYPTMGSLFSHELGREQAELPKFVSINPYRFLSPAAYGPGFLGPQASPLVVGSGNVSVAPGGNGDAIARSLKVRNLDRPEAVKAAEAKSRLDLLADLQREFAATRPDITVQSHQTAYQQAVRMMNAEGVKAFDLTGEKDKLRDAYGRNLFGQSCLLARRLVERGVPFVEVSLNSAQSNMGLGWDTHQNNFGSVKRLCEVLDPAWATLLSDLKQRGLLENTLVVWMGEFGRTPRINRNQGRDHFSNAWSTALCGGGIRGATGRRKDQRQRHAGRRSPRLGSRSTGHRLRCVGDRSQEAEHVEHRTPDSRRRCGSQADQGADPVKTIALLSLFCLSGWVSAGHAQSPPPRLPEPSRPLVSPEVQDICFFGEKYPVFVRLHVMRDRRGFRAAWNRQFDKRFRELDTDSDNVLSVEESKRATEINSSTGSTILNSLLSKFTNERTVVLRADTKPKDGKVTRQELNNYLRSRREGPFHTRSGGPGRRVSNSDSAAIVQQLFDKLDLDDNGKLSSSELLAARQTLEKSDTDEDETLSVAELRGGNQQNVYYNN